MSHPHFLGSMTLKALLEDPNLKNPPLIQQSQGGGSAKVKKEGGNDGPLYNYGSAFLGPNLWADKSSYGGMDLNLEYMDLDEFLSENEIGGAPPHDAQTQQLKGIEIEELDVSEEDILAGLGGSSPQAPVIGSPRQFLRTPPLSPSQFSTTAATVVAGTTTSATSIPLPIPHSSQTQQQSVSVYPDHHHQHPHHAMVPSPSSSVGVTSQLEQQLDGQQRQQSSNPGSPFHVDFHVSEQDLALTVAPGVNFDPRKRNFTDEELKPQPIIKKSKKVFVPEDLKDDKYWNRRFKNNFAAKRSRDARRVKENQIALRAAYLEKENKCLKDEMSKLRKENAALKTVADKYEPGTSASISEAWS